MIRCVLSTITRSVIVKVNEMITKGFVTIARVFPPHKDYLFRDPLSNNKEKNQGHSIIIVKNELAR